MSQPNVMVIGDIMLDAYVIGFASRLSPEAPVPVIVHQREEMRAGGAANVALNIAAMNGKVTLVSLVGDDNEGETLLSLLPTGKINTAHVVKHERRPTTVKTRIVAGQHQLARIDREDVSDIPDDVAARLQGTIEDLLGSKHGGHGFDAIVISDYAKGVVSERIVTATLEAAKAHRPDGIPVIIDPKRKNFRVYSGATLITPNVAEAQNATGKSAICDEDAIDVASSIANTCQCAVLLTRSEMGMLLCPGQGESKAVFISPNPVTVSDVSGAGDTVVAACAISLAKDKDLEAACRLAAAAAEVAVSKPGTSVVSEAEILRRLAENSHDRFKDAG